MLSEGVNKNRISLEHLVHISSHNASKIFSMDSQKGAIEAGSDADITMIDLKLEKRVSNELFGGFSDYIVYEGWNLKGWPVKTIVRGSVVAEDFNVIGKTGHGKFVKRNVTKNS